MARKIKNFALESQGLLLPQKGIDGLAAGVDEAGRGCLAGPVVAGAVIFPDDFDLVGLGDSKTIPEKERVRLAVEIKQLAVGWGLGVCWLKDITRHNIQQASLLAMVKAIVALRINMKVRPGTLMPHRVLIDGNQILPPVFFSIYCLPVPDMQAIVKGDALIPAISAASILAKTYRDHLMIHFDKRWPQYGFARHKGYGTQEHREALDKFGPCPMHRLEFHGVSDKSPMVQGRLF